MDEGEEDEEDDDEDEEDDESEEDRAEKNEPMRLEIEFLGTAFSISLALASRALNPFSTLFK